MPFQPYFILQLIFDNMPATYTRGRLIFSLLEIIVRPILEGDLYQRATYTRINTVIKLVISRSFLRCHTSDQPKGLNEVYVTHMDPNC